MIDLAAIEAHLARAIDDGLEPEHVATVRGMIREIQAGRKLRDDLDNYYSGSLPPTLRTAVEEYDKETT